MLTIKDENLAKVLSSVFREITSPLPVNMIDWMIEDFTISMILEKDFSNQAAIPRPSSYQQKAENSRILLRRMTALERVNVHYQAILTSEKSVRYGENGEIEFGIPYPFPAKLKEATTETVCQNLNFHLNRLFSPRIDEDSHLYYNAAPPEITGLVGRFGRNEIQNLSNLYYAFTHSGFYKMFGDPEYQTEEIGGPTSYRSLGRQRSGERPQASEKRSPDAIAPRKKKEKVQKEKLPREKNVIARSADPNIREAERHVHSIGEMNFNRALSRPSANSRGMRRLKTLRRLRVAVLIAAILLGTPIVAKATGANEWFTASIKQTQLGGMLLNTEPHAAFSPDTGKIIENVPVTFINQSQDSDPNDTINRSYWVISYKDSILYESQEMHMIYSFPSQGEYTVSLTVEDARGKMSQAKVMDYRVFKPVKGEAIPGETIK